MPEISSRTYSIVNFVVAFQVHVPLACDMTCHGCDVSVCLARIGILITRIDELVVYIGDTVIGADLFLDATRTICPALTMTV